MRGEEEARAALPQSSLPSLTQPLSVDRENSRGPEPSQLSLKPPLREGPQTTVLRAETPVRAGN